MDPQDQSQLDTKLSPEFIGLGELLWDCFPDRRLPGGAPANVAYHAQQLGLRAAIVTRVGSDALGDEICEFLRSHGLGIELVQRDAVHKTGTVTVVPTPTGAGYTFLADSAWDFLAPQPELMAAMRSARAVGFGTLAQRADTSRRTIHDCLASASDDCLIVYDVNLRPPFYEREWIEKSLLRATVVKLNDDEVPVLSNMFGVPKASDRDFARHLLDTWPQVELVCVTRGANGCLAASREGEIIEERGIPLKVEAGVKSDQVGAGDAFTAALIGARLAGMRLDRSLHLANRVGSLVASAAGAMPDYRGELAALRREFT